MTLYQALDIFGKISKQRLPIAHKLRELRDRPAIYGGGQEIVSLATVSFCSGDYVSWPVKVKTHVIGTDRVKIDPSEFALEHHFDGNVRKQARAKEPRLDGQRMVPEEVSAIHAHISGVLEREDVPTDVLIGLLLWFPRDKDDPLHTHCDRKTWAKVKHWLTQSDIATKAGYSVR